LLVAAAMREVLSHEPVVVGGTAQDFYTGNVYVQTDLDLVGWLTPEEEGLLRDLGFTKTGRHWFHSASKIAVEFPEGTIAGDKRRIVHISVGSGSAAIIGVEDLYLDRIRQTTMYPPGFESTEFKGAVAVAVASYEDFDWNYVDQEIKTTEEKDPSLGKDMREIHNKVRRRLLLEMKR
jgi:hypothetical protein